MRFQRGKTKWGRVFIFSTTRKRDGDVVWTGHGQIRVCLEKSPPGGSESPRQSRQKRRLRNKKAKVTEKKAKQRQAKKAKQRQRIINKPSQNTPRGSRKRSAKSLSTFTSWELRHLPSTARGRTLLCPGCKRATEHDFGRTQMSCSHCQTSYDGRNPTTSRFQLTFEATVAAPRHLFLSFANFCFFQGFVHRNLVANEHFE